MCWRTFSVSWSIPSDRWRNCSPKNSPISFHYSSRSKMCRRVTNEKRKQRTHSILMICSRKRSGCWSSTNTSRDFTGGNSNSSWSTNIKTRIRSRPISSIYSRASTRTSWWLVMTRSRSTRGEARISKISSNFRTVIPTHRCTGLS